jgi:hypothetical protein
MNSIAILVLLLMIFGYIYLMFVLVSMTIDLVKILNISAIFNGTWWEKNVTTIEDLTLEKFPLGEERIFTGKYISHWEIARFQIVSANCQLDMPDACGWDWLVVALGNPTTRAEYSGTFDLEFRGKIVERGQFGHKGMCTYRIEVMEMLSVKQLT